MAYIRYLSKDQTILKDIIYNMGCIKKQQVYQLFNNIPEDRIDKVYLHFLIQRKYIKCINNDIYVPHDDVSGANIDTINLLWAMLKMASCPDDIHNALTAAKPIDYYMTRNGNEVLEFMIINQGDLIKLRNIQEVIEVRNSQAQKNEIAECRFVLVITDKAILEKVKNYSFNITIYVVFIEYMANAPIPRVRLLKKTPDE